MLDLFGILELILIVISFDVISYESQESATAAVESMNGKKIDEDHPCLVGMLQSGIFLFQPVLIHISVKYAESDAQRAVRKANLPVPDLETPTKQYTTLRPLSPPREV